MGRRCRLDNVDIRAGGVNVCLMPVVKGIETKRDRVRTRRARISGKYHDSAPNSS